MIITILRETYVWTGSFAFDELRTDEIRWTKNVLLVLLFSDFNSKRYRIRQMRYKIKSMLFVAYI